ncbi:uncharacterized protein [Watersipora subatra]|uniref:uncharacterized protein isoform X2 n=1 Tax=Watersipora subatra TaxID=2589382 RepID=UPI00355C97D7
MADDHNTAQDGNTEGEDDFSFYESYWAQNTTAHGVSRVVNTHKFQRIVWIVALLVCFGYVSYEISRGVGLYRQFLTSTEINQINQLKIEFPSVTICNFNRWRNSYLTPEVLEQLEEVIQLYSYNYVIPDIEESPDPEKLKVLDVLDPTTTPKPTQPPPSTTPPLPLECSLPPKVRGLDYQVRGTISSDNTVPVGATLTYRCVTTTDLLLDGDEVHTCSANGEFEERVPICISTTDTGERYVLSNNASDSNAIAASSPLVGSNGEASLPNVTMCFWMKTQRSDTLGTILSYGVGGTTVVSATQVPQSASNSIFGVKYTLFDIEGNTITLTSYDQWNPFCIQYSVSLDSVESHSVLKFYKYLMFENTFRVYEEDKVRKKEEFPLNGNIVLFNSYQNYLNVLANKPIDTPSAGGSVTNINIWDRTLPVEIMNRLLWNGNLFGLTSDQVASISGTIWASTVTFNVTEGQSGPASVIDEDLNGALTRSKRSTNFVEQMNHVQKLRVKRQNEEGSETPQTTITTAATSEENGPVSPFPTNASFPRNNTEDTLKKVFNYAAFTKTAGWQLVDDKSNHSSEEPKTLLSCTYRSQKCDSRWFTHRFGSYGNCYTFNKNLADSLVGENVKLPLIQDSPGPLGGLNLLLDMQTWEYAESTALNGNSELGLKFIVHAPYEVPVIDSMGYAVGPGTKAFVGFSKTNTTNFYEPWGRCDPERKLVYNEQYTVNACGIECKLARVVDHCGCKPYYYPGDFDICTFTQLSECAYIQIAIVNADFGNLCNCPIACHSETYDVKLSYTDFPNSPYGVQLGDELNISLPQPSPGTPVYDSRSQYLRGNVANLDIYYETLAEVDIKQNKAMDITALLGNIGGQLGLFIGCSFLTAFEFLECIFISCAYHWKRGVGRIKKKKGWSPNTSFDAELGEHTNGSKHVNNGEQSVSVRNGKYPSVE